MKLWRNFFQNRTDTVETYLKTYGKMPFGAYAFNDVDSLLLCQLAYLRFDGMVPGLKGDHASVTLKSLRQHPQRERLFHKIIFARENRTLFAWMSESRRFANLRLNCYVNLVEKTREVQFAAVTFLLEDGTVYVAFRGTDETFVGWKEDFNMAFLCPVPGQTMAVRYLNTVARRFSGPFYVGGHSKGGNFAVYGAMYCASEVRRRILRIYNMDGPGFRPEIFRSMRYAAIADRVVKYLPAFSIVGMLLSGDNRYRAVAARSYGPVQHDPFRWKIRNGRFVLLKDIYPAVHRTDNALNQWIFSMNEEQRKLMVDTMYQIVSETQTESVLDFAADWKSNVGRLVRAFRKVDGNTMGILRRNVDAFWGILRAQEDTKPINALPVPGRKRGSVPPTA